MASAHHEPTAPNVRPNGDLTSEDMARVTGDDFAALGHIARSYCRTVDYTRTRKRMDGSATMARQGVGKYGTDDVSDDTRQDAVLIFAKRLRDVLSTCAVASVDSGEQAWKYIKRSGETIIITRNTLHWWAVRDAAAKNGYRLDVEPDEIDAAPGDQVMRGIPHADNVASLAVTPYLSAHRETIFRSAWGDGSDYPTLDRMLHHAENSKHRGRAGLIWRTAQDLYGGPEKSTSKRQRARDAGEREWRELSARLEEIRKDLIGRNARVETS